MYIRGFIQAYRGMKNDTSPFLVESLPQKNFHFIWAFFLTFLAFIEVYVLAIATYAICFTGKISRVHTIVVT